MSKIGFWLGIAAALAVGLMPTPEGLSAAAHATLAAGTLMGIWWITEALPVAATALVPVFLFPLLGVGTVGQATAPYANHIIYLFLGGFLLAAGLERSGLHRRLALAVVAGVGVSPPRLILGFLLATALLSMWISNTATALMMLPIAMTVATIGGDTPGSARGASALLLAVAYGSSVGGLGTLIGTPPNAIMAGYLQQAHGIEVGFGEWMLVGVPLVAIALPATYWVLRRTLRFEAVASEETAMAVIARQRAELGPWSAAEVRVANVFVLAALCWSFQPVLSVYLPGLSDAGVGIFAGLLLFLVPDGKGSRLLEWSDVERIPWGVLVLFGGGLSLADAVQRTELAGWIGGLLSGFQALPLPLLIFLATLLVIFLTEITSNSATAAAFLPVMGALAVSLGHDPRVLVVPAALAASCAFMLPVATPPNAIVFGTGNIMQRDMIRAGFRLNIVFSVLITAAVLALGWR